MLKSEKEEMIKSLNEKFSRAKSVIVTEFNKLDVATVTRLRRKLRDGGIDYKVLKNTLAMRAAKGTPVEVVAKDFVGPISVSIGYADVVAPAKILTDFIKDIPAIKVKSAMVDGQRTDSAGVQALAKLPGLPELRATLLGLLNQPATQLLRTVKEPSGALARVIQARVDQQPAA